MTDISLEQGQVAAADAFLHSSETVFPDSAAAQQDDAQQANAFAELGLAEELVRAVADLGYTQPTPVQEQAIPLAMHSGGEQPFVDLMVSSQTGSGKTAAFLLPVLHTLIAQRAEEDAKARAEHERLCAEAVASGQPAPKRNKRKDPTNPRNFKAAVPGALILCPTRELAQQVAHDAIELVKHCRGIRIANVVGGMPYQLQIAKLQNANLVVATPGRLLDLQRSLQIKLDQVQFLVVDEADRMLDLGFADDLAEINQLTSQRKQTMMFSATFAPRIQQLAMRVMHDGGANVQKITIATAQQKHENIKQALFWADSAQHKRKLLDHWLRDTNINQAIVFASTQVECDGLANDLQQDGFSAVALHGALSQGLRNRRLMALRNGQVQVLVATDVAARGLDVPSITHVFNYGLPMKAEDYTHRIGRTGRAGREGIAVTFAEFRDRRRVFDIEGYTRQQFKAEVIPGLEPTQRFPSARESERGGRGRSEGRGGYGARRGDGHRGDGHRGDAHRDGDGYGRKSGFGSFGGGRGNERGGERGGERSGFAGARGDRFADRGFGGRDGGGRPGFGAERAERRLDRGAERSFNAGAREGDFGRQGFGGRGDTAFRGTPPAHGEARGFGGGDRPAFGKSAAKPYQPHGERGFERKARASRSRDER